MLALVTVAVAGEGMWLPEQVPGLAEELRAAGFTVSAAALSDPLAPPLSAIASLGGCSASFVSPDGLMLSNLHCVDGWVAYNSTGDVDHLSDGFTAASRADELPAGPSARVYVLEASDDVTEAVRGAVFAPGVDDAGRVAVLDRTRTALVDRCERAPGRKCRVASFDGGASYRLLRSLELRDVRLVHTPSDLVGYFGGDADNFEWPRHDADYGVFRAYVGRDGRPADPSPRNVPYRPASHLTIDPTGAQPGEPVMAIGYPGGTSRLALPEELRFEVESENPHALSVDAELEAILAEERAKSPDADRHLVAAAYGLANSRKYVQGIQDNVAASTVLADKDALGAAVDALVAADPARKAAIEELRSVLAADRAAALRSRAVRDLLQATWLQVAHHAYRWSVEREKKPADREPGFQDRDRDDLVAWLSVLDEQTWPSAERHVFAGMLARYVDAPAEQHLAALDAWLAAQGGPEKAVEALFASDAFGTAEGRLSALDRKRAAHEASPEPWTALAVLLERELFASERAAGKARQGALLRLRPAWVSAVREVRGGRSYPDANSTLRITFGSVEGYRVRDGLVATPLTGLAGIVEKDRLPEYEAPPPLRAALARPVDPRWLEPSIGDGAVNFLSSLDTTGGNSGSATLNAEGRLVGLVFDGNYESMAADWQFDPAVTRTVHVDVRYLGWWLSQDPRGAWILSELGLGSTGAAAP
jgi:hypothetical protein